MSRISLNKGAGLAAAFVVIIFLFSLDFFTKEYMRRIDVGVCNEGVSFGIVWLSEPVVIAISILLIIAGGIAGVVYLLTFKRGSFVEVDILWLGLVLMIVGGFSNLISRIQWGCVWDWISLGMGDLYFNVADVIIDLGLILFTLGVAVIFYKNRKNEQKQKRQE